MGYNKKGKCGIYCILNTINTKKYIGQSISMYDRWLTHLKDLENNVHHSFHLQRAYNKYGKEAFIHSTLIECSEEELDILETKFVKETKSDNRKFGYNIRLAGNNFSKESRLKLSNSLKKSEKVKQARRNMWLTRERNKINQYNLNGEFIKTWDSTTQASIELKINSSSIRKVCTQSHGCFSIGGFQFRDYKGSIENIEAYTKAKFNKRGKNGK